MKLSRIFAVRYFSFINAAGRDAGAPSTAVAPSIAGVFCMVLLLCVSALATDNAEEQRQLAILQSNSSPQEKDAACVRLKQVATAASVPALAALLGDTQLSHSALYVLESMSAAEAGRALTEALDKTSGLTRVGIISSLGNRKETQALSALGKMMLDTDHLVVQAAAAALGKIGGPEAVKALGSSLPGANESVHAAIVDGLLRAGDAFLAAGDSASSAPLFERLYRGKESDWVRVAAYAGMIRAAGQGAPGLVVQGIEGNDAAAQMAALQAARTIQDPAMGKTLAPLLAKSSPPVQLALIGILSQRGEVTAVPEIVAVAKNGAPEVRAAAIEALGGLADSSVVPWLARSAAETGGALQAAARRSLGQLNRGPVTEVMLAQLTEAKPAVQAEIARALGERREVAAVPRLLTLTQSGAGSTRGAALQALASLVGPAQLDALVELVVNSKSESTRSDAAQALNTALQRIKSTQGRIEADAVAKGLSSANPVEGRVALLALCSGLPAPAIRTALRASLNDPEPRIRSAAVRALCDTADGELLPDLLKIACGGGQESLRSLAIGGCVRLTTQEEGVKLTNEQKTETLKAILASSLSNEQKRLVLSGLAEIPDPAALKLVEPMLGEAGVRAEAARAAVRIAPALSDNELAAVTLKKVIAMSEEPALRRDAEAALKKVEARGGFITAWQVAGPYRQANRNYSALFDIAFAPELPDAAGVEWRSLPPCTDAARPWSMDVLKFFGGEQCVAYARTWVYSARDQPARMEIGSDDGAKIWLNGKVVHANNTARPLQPAQDKADIELKQGWNPLLLKLTQNNLGWEFCVRLTNPDGSLLDRVRVDPSRGH